MTTTDLAPTFAEPIGDRPNSDKELDVEQDSKPPLPVLLKRARLRLLELHRQANAGHIGGNLSCIDCLIVLHHAVLEPDDLFLLSKGHSAGALYTTLWSRGLLSDEEMLTFTRDGTRLGVHPPVNDPEIAPFGTGSLGHGPSLAAGMALGRMLRRQEGRVFCLCSDGEWQEGSCWEALIFAVHQQLANLLLIIDANGLQGFGSTREVASMGLRDLAARLEAFGAAVTCCDGHDPLAMKQALAVLDDYQKRPQVVLLETCKGRGVCSLEGTLASHYLPLTDEQYETARKRLED